MKVPPVVNVLVLVVATTGFYTYVGQLVPQKELQPPADVKITKDMTTADLVKIGDEIAHDKGMCLTCHTIGKTGALRYPDLQGVGERAKTRKPGYSDIDYFSESLYEPDAYIVPGFNKGMPTINKPPIGLTDEEILAVMAWLQSQGGTPNVTLKTTHKHRSKAD